MMCMRSPIRAIFFFGGGVVSMVLYIIAILQECNVQTMRSRFGF